MRRKRREATTLKQMTFSRHSPPACNRVQTNDKSSRIQCRLAETIQCLGRSNQIAKNNPFSKDAQVTAIHGARKYLGDKLIRTAKPHQILDPANGPLIAVRLSILTRKTLGGLHTDLDGRMLDVNGDVIEGLFAAGEAAGFGGGGYHGYNALEGTFLGGCIFSGRQIGRSSFVA